ncbi:MAG: tRNA 4-thiouridine(8) synthase ThiI [Candidatus Micrarchaeota archaeon]|nr:tRNA 4-thiouridine(8) synthase ThiI [Candidatus Micrarchaeota archaeon]
MEFKPGEELVVVHFGELWLKGRNRNEYIRLLDKNIREQLSGESFELKWYFDRLILRPEKNSDMTAIATRLKKVFGVSAFELSLVSKPEIESIDAAAKKLLSRKPRPESVRIDSHRSYKQLPFTSVDVVNSIKKTAAKLGIEPKTKGYEKELDISITKDAAFLTLDRERGARGLPVGSSGKAVILISGGIDSPVAAWYAMKRGLEPVYLHVHAFRDNAYAEKGKVSGIIGTLSSFYLHSKSYFVPSYIFQANSAKFGRYELILLKAFMLRLAEKVAEKEGARLIVTGESLGQVASQTSSNLAAEEQGVNMPILRPLIGLDKEEIITLAKTIGTYEDSIKPYQDVCSINAKNPKTSTKTVEMKKMLKDIGINRIAGRSLKASSVAST